MQLGAESLGFCHGHGRVDAKAPGLVAGCGHDSARTVASYGYGHSAQLREVALLHRGEEGIHVDVYYLSGFDISIGYKG